MATTNVEVVQRALDALAVGGVEAMLAFVHEGFEMVTPPEFAAEPGEYRGHAGVRRWFDSFYEAMEEVRLEYDAIAPAGAAVAVALRIVARGRSTGIEQAQEAAALCAVADARIRRMRFFGSLHEAIEAGLSE